MLLLNYFLGFITGLILATYFIYKDISLFKCSFCGKEKTKLLEYKECPCRKSLCLCEECKKESWKKVIETSKKIFK